MPDKGVQIRVIYFDDDLVELEVVASNSTFRAQANVYTSQDVCRMMTDLIRGFPKDLSDNRELVLGTFDTRYAGGGVKLQFSCLNSSGHSQVVATIQTDGRLQQMANAVFTIPIEASGMDQFVNELSQLKLEVGQQARLPCAG